MSTYRYVPTSTASVLKKSVLESELWNEIRRKSISDPILKDMLEQVKVYYILKYKQRFDND